LIPYTLSTSVQGSGTLLKQPDQPTYTYGDVVTVTPTPESGWYFIGWEGALAGDQTPATVTITGNLSLEAIFSNHKVSLSTHSIGGGAVVVTPTQHYYLPGSQVTVAAQAEP